MGRHAYLLVSQFSLPYVFRRSNVSHLAGLQDGIFSEYFCFKYLRSEFIKNYLILDFSVTNSFMP